ncbi:hypothetical protein N7462_008817 [Penicillium macrosclerotiorum]|uniref:uncharacterized protein n=1 Tax=Penicillium macrosclerotiorum TaxID=303699 RepID=UPI002547542F|nr:uncharacterized protein N7462_008817 [Penicillium macrosclerotiorum]KAJ5675920.1 hypothetical protein N7462_008817 [Penicillium macrosclerotiorum]
MGPNDVRRNLFHQNLSRRPAAPGPPSTAVPPGNNGITHRPSHRLKSSTSDSSSSRSSRSSENRDIVVRDKNGSYKLEMPALPQTLVGEDGEELGELDTEEADEMAFNSSKLNALDKEKFDDALVEMMIRHRNRQTNGEPDEILNIVHQSLRKKVASLDDDNWMFEPEKEMRF